MALSQISFRWSGSTRQTPILAQQVLMRTQTPQRRTGREIIQELEEILVCAVRLWRLLLASPAQGARQTASPQPAGVMVFMGKEKSAEIAENTHSRVGVFKQKCCSAGEQAGDAPRTALPRAWRKISRGITKIEQGHVRQDFMESRSPVGLPLILQMLTIRQWCGTRKGMFSWMLQLLFHNRHLRHSIPVLLTSWPEIDKGNIGRGSGKIKKKNKPWKQKE